MTVCHLLECIYNDRGNDPRCTLERETELNDKGQCLNFKTDYEYLRTQFHESLNLSIETIKALSYENLVLSHTSELKRIMRGETATRVLTHYKRGMLQNREILKRNGRYLEVSSRAISILEAKRGRDIEEKVFDGGDEGAGA